MMNLLLLHYSISCMRIERACFTLLYSRNAVLLQQCSESRKCWVNISRMIPYLGFFEKLTLRQGFKHKYFIWELKETSAENLENQKSKKKKHS